MKINADITKVKKSFRMMRIFLGGALHHFSDTGSQEAHMEQPECVCFGYRETSDIQDQQQKLGLVVKLYCGAL